MGIKAIFLDFYGTLVHEDDAIIPLICEQIKANARSECDVKAIGGYWWRTFSTMFQSSFGDAFRPQRELGIASLADTIRHFQSDCIAEELIQPQFDHWMKPVLYDDTLPFIHSFAQVPIAILSNIDTSDLHCAAAHHRIEVTDMITSEDVQAYKPRPEMFMEALTRLHLQPDDVVHIGDSFSSDVGGAGRLGIRTVWLNRLNKRRPEGIEPDHICRDLREVQEIVLRDLA